MKAITLTQPWATLMAIGAKRIETRSWQTPYRGPIAIHAGKGLAGMSKADFEALCTREPFWSALSAPGVGWHGLRCPRGVILATATLNWILPIHGAWVPQGMYTVCSRTWPAWSEKQELAFGDYSPHRYAWLLQDVRPLAVPIPAKGALGLWECDNAGVRV